MRFPSSTRAAKAFAVIAAFASAAISATAALAFDATANVALNVRTGPGTEYSILDTLTAGEQVNVFECTQTGWCYVNQDGPDGWVSSAYLTQVAPPPPPPQNPPQNPPQQGNNCRFEVTLGPGGPQFNLVCDGGNNPPPPPPPNQPAPNTACFYTGANYTGDEFCNGIGTLDTLNAQFNDRISSLKINGNIVVTLCNNAFLGGACADFNANTANLGAADNRASSIKIAPPAPVVPPLKSFGPIALQQTFTVDLDTGTVGAAGADVWFRAINAVQKNLTPRNGAEFALGDGSNREYLGCLAETYSSNPISLGAIPIGTHICVKTSEGRIAQFRLLGISGTTLNLYHRTWN